MVRNGSNANAKPSSRNNCTRLHKDEQTSCTFRLQSLCLTNSRPSRFQETDGTSPKKDTNEWGDSWPNTKTRDEQNTCRHLQKTLVNGAHPTRQLVVPFHVIQTSLSDKRNPDTPRTCGPITKLNQPLRNILNHGRVSPHARGC